MIHKDYSYISADEMEAVKRGFGKIMLLTVWMEAYVGEDAKLLDGLSLKECIEKRHEQLMKVRDYIAKNYDVHQLDAETSTWEHYGTDWDLYYHDNRNVNHNPVPTLIDFSINTNRSLERRQKLEDELEVLLSKMDIPYIYVRLQYCFKEDEAAVIQKMTEMHDLIEHNPVTYQGVKGKLFQKDGGFGVIGRKKMVQVLPRWAAVTLSNMAKEAES